MGYEIVDEEDDYQLRDSSSGYELMVVGTDDRAAILTWYIKATFPHEFEKLKGDAGKILIRGVRVEADDCVRIDYTTVNEED